MEAESRISRQSVEEDLQQGCEMFKDVIGLIRRDVFTDAKRPVNTGGFYRRNSKQYLSS